MIERIFIEAILVWMRRLQQFHSQLNIWSNEKAGTERDTDVSIGAIMKKNLN